MIDVSFDVANFKRTLEAYEEACRAGDSGIDEEQQLLHVFEVTAYERQVARQRIANMLAASGAQV